MNLTTEQATRISSDIEDKRFPIAWFVALGAAMREELNAQGFERELSAKSGADLAVMLMCNMFLEANE